MEYYHQITCCLKGNLCIFWSCEGGEKKTLTGNFNAAPRRKPLHSNYSMQEANSPWNKCLMGNRGQSMRRLQASLASLRGERVSATPPAASANPPPSRPNVAFKAQMMSTRFPPTDRLCSLFFQGQWLPTKPLSPKVHVDPALTQATIKAFLPSACLF